MRRREPPLGEGRGLGRLHDGQLRPELGRAGARRRGVVVVVDGGGGGGRRGAGEALDELLERGLIGVDVGGRRSGGRRRGGARDRLPRSIHGRGVWRCCVVHAITDVAERGIY